MKVCLKIDDSVFSEIEEILSQTQKSRNKYIDEALEFYNRHQRRLLLENDLIRESLLVRKNSMSVLKEFEALNPGN